jgi:hypothetical protein
LDVTKANHAQATRGNRRPNRRRGKADDPAWFRPYCRAEYAMTATIVAIGVTLRKVAGSRRCAHRHPVRASLDLRQAEARLLGASVRWKRAADALAQMTQCIPDDPDSPLSSMLAHANERWEYVGAWLQQAADDVSALQADVLAGLVTGRLVPEPERPAGRRPRISVAPRPVPIRAFLLLRQPRVVDRISPILRRRRRTPRPASVRVPRRSLLGRAPPLFPLSVP